MNREIKFRAWNMKKKVMVYNHEDGSDDYWDGVVASPIEIVNNNVGKRDRYNPYEWMQFTGLKDKNGKEIYEGDILKEEEGHVMEVYYHEDCFGVRPTESEYFNLASHLEEANYEVIGNIYENKDLLK